MIDKIIKSFAKRSRNTKSEASNDSPLSGLFILPIPHLDSSSDGKLSVDDNSSYLDQKTNKLDAMAKVKYGHTKAMYECDLR